MYLMSHYCAENFAAVQYYYNKRNTEAKQLKLLNVVQK